MSKVTIDTDKYNELVGTFSNCVQSYNDNVNTFFDNIINNKGWKGDAATKYIDKTIVDKEKYIIYGESLVKFVDTLYALGANIDSSASTEVN